MADAATCLHRYFRNCGDMDVNVGVVTRAIRRLIDGPNEWAGENPPTKIQGRGELPFIE